MDKYQGKIYREGRHLMILVKCKECALYHPRRVKEELYDAWEARKFDNNPAQWDYLQEKISEYKNGKENQIQSG